MVRPLPPVVHGPITPVTPSVRVTSVADNAIVELVCNGTSIGLGTSGIGGTLWVPIFSPPYPGDSVAARQSNADGTSDDSAHPLTVTAPPDPLPSPVFVSPLSTCMSALLLDGLQPGSTVRILQHGVEVGSGTALKTSEWISIDPNVALTAGDALEAVQELAFSGTIFSGSATSLPIPLASREGALPAPGVGQPLIACRSSVDLFGITPSAEIQINNEGQQVQATNLASAYHLWGLPQLQEGRLVARQAYPRCSMESGETIVEVGPPAAPGPPTILAAPCRDTRRIRVSGLVPPALVELATVVPDPSQPGQSIVTPVGVARATESSEDFDLPTDVEPVTTSGHAVSLRISQALCGLSSTSTPVGFATPASPTVPVTVSPLYECTRRLQVENAHPGALLQPIYADSDDPIGDLAIATGSRMTLSLWAPLGNGRKVLVRQSGCGANGHSPVERVEDLPNPLPAPEILEPVRPGASSVTVGNCLPGARVHLLVNRVVRKSIDTAMPDTIIPTGDLNLAEHDELWAIQTLCSEASTPEGTQTIVTRGDMKLSVSPHSVQRGSSAPVTVSATDADTGEPVGGAKVFLDGALVGQTGVAFPFSPSPAQAPPAGLVSEPIAYNNTTFTITLTDPPPEPRGTLFLNVGPTTLIPGALWLVSATWTVTPLWAPGQALSASSSSAAIEIPNPPSASSDRRLSISLQTTWQVQGMIGGYSYDPVQISGRMDPDPTGLAWDGTNLTAGWLVLWEQLYDEYGHSLLLVSTKYQGAH